MRGEPAAASSPRAARRHAVAAPMRRSPNTAKRLERTSPETFHEASLTNFLISLLIKKTVRRPIGLLRPDLGQSHLRLAFGTPDDAP